MWENWKTSFLAIELVRGSYPMEGWVGLKINQHSGWSITPSKSSGQFASFVGEKLLYLEALFGEKFKMLSENIWVNRLFEKADFFNF